MTESIPHVLGLALRRVGRGSWQIELGPITARIRSTSKPERFDADCACRVLIRGASIEDCVRAIENELREIRNAIPAEPWKPRDLTRESIEARIKMMDHRVNAMPLEERFSLVADLVAADNKKAAQRYAVLATRALTDELNKPESA